MRAARYESACPKLAESYALDARPGVLFTLAECEAKGGKLASAFAHYDDYLRLYAAMPTGMRAAQRERAKIAKRQRDALSSRVPMLTLALPPDGGAGLTVRRNDVTLGAPSFGVELPVDPGNQTITVIGADGVSRSTTLAVGPGDRVRVDLASLIATQASGERAAAPSRPAPRVAIALLGVGAAGLVVGGVTGGLALAGKSTVAAHCVGTRCDVEGKQAADRAKALGWASTVGFGVGIAAVATGAVLWLAGSRRSVTVGRAHVTPTSWMIDRNTNALGVTGRF